MVEEEGFLGRWSRLKHEAAREAQAALEEPADAPEAVVAPTSAPAPEAETEAAGCEVEKLPPLESLGADSDYTPFLAHGVPAALRTLALRKAWASDPAIAGFRGFAEYDWDCNAPGFGKLLATDDVRRLCEKLFRGSDREDDGAAPAAPEAVPAESEPVVATESAIEPSGEQPLPATDDGTIAAPGRFGSNIGGRTAG
jgi:hypothetical protein